MILQPWASAPTRLRPCRMAWGLRTSLGATDSISLDSNFLASASVILDENICVLRK